jgi:heme exporter protein A
VTPFTGESLTCVRGERAIFSGLNFTLAAGGAIVLTGNNGSGKSSLLRMMAGLLAPAAGRLAWEGADISSDPAAHRMRLHYLGHADAVKPALTVAENVGFWGRFRGPGGEAEEAVAVALDAFGIAQLADLPARFLSAGQRRRTALARLVISAAPLWLLDEPKTALDAGAVAALDAAIARHRLAGGRVVVAQHGLEPVPGATLLVLGPDVSTAGAD